MGMEGRDRLHAPGLTLRPLRFRPLDRLPARGEHQARAGVGELDAVTAGFVDVEEEGLLNRVLMRSRLDMDPVLEEDVSALEDVLAGVRRECDVVQPPRAPRVVCRVDNVVRLAVEVEPLRRDLAAVETDLLGGLAAESLVDEDAFLFTFLPR